MHIEISLLLEESRVHVTEADVKEIIIIHKMAEKLLRWKEYSLPQKN
jgi:hypothetical protein